MATVESDERLTTGPLSWPAEPKVKLGDLGAEAELSETEQAFRDTAHAFARDVMRPVGQKLDRMTPEEVIAPESPIWDFRKKFLDLEINPITLGSLPPREIAKVLPILLEEFGWGDAGLSIVIGGCQLFPLVSLMFGKSYLLERYPTDMIGAWSITEPDHGSDALDPSRQIFHAQGKYGRPNCVVTRKGNQLVINGQKSAWGSNGPIADLTVLYAAFDDGNGPSTEEGIVMLVPLDAPGISRGKSIDKMGQRPLPQCEIYFDNVVIDDNNVIAWPDDYKRAVYAIHCEANGQMGAVFTGVARSAFELAFRYAHERKQGGVPIIRHQSVAHRLFHMYRKVEASRALVRRVSEYNTLSEIPSLQSAMAVKVTATQTAFEVASDALQMFGGNGNTREYPIEKILRDARASLIEDGCNEILGIKAGFQMIDPDLI